MRYDSQRLNQQTTAIGGGGVTRLIWSTGRIGHVTQQNRNIRIAIDQRDRNCKIGEGGGLACEKLQRNLSGNSSYLTTPLRDPIREEANAGTHIGCNLTTTAEEPA